MYSIHLSSLLSQDLLVPAWYFEPFDTVSTVSNHVALYNSRMCPSFPPIPISPQLPFFKTYFIFTLQTAQTCLNSWGMF